MTLSLEDRQELIKHYVEKAQRTVEDVKFFIENEKLGVAINRCITNASNAVISAFGASNDSQSTFFPIMPNQISTRLSQEP